MDFEAFIKDIVDNKWNVFGVEVYEKGELIHSFGDTTNLYDIYSATKTITSIAVGIAYDRGLIDFNQSILKYMPEEKVNTMSQKQKETFEKISVQRLLTMGVKGFPFRPEGDNYLDFSLDCKIEDTDLVGFNYSNICTFLVCVALTQILGEDLGEFIKKNIFEPLNIINYEIGRSPEGYFYGASKAKLSVHDVSKIGLLLYNEGVYNGKRIVSQEYVKLATSVQQMNREGGYGYYIWKYRNGYSINGKFKQKCYILPQEDLVITYLACIEDDSKDLLKSMERNLLQIIE